MNDPRQPDPIMTLEWSKNHMQRWQSHKMVWASKITAVDVETATVSIEGGVYKPGQSWLAKHRPEAGMVLVCYDDGYLSVSPDRAFADGYTQIS